MNLQFIPCDECGDVPAFKNGLCGSCTGNAVSKLLSNLASDSN